MRPMLQRLTRDIEAKGGLDWLCEEVSGGRTLGKLSKELGVSRGMMYTYLKHMDKQGHEALRRYKRALIESGSAHAEEALEIVDEPVLDSADAQRNRERARTRMWFAERLDKETFGQRAETQVMVIGELHLAALQRLGRPEAQAPALPAEDVVDAEVIEDDVVDVVGEFL